MLEAMVSGLQLVMNWQFIGLVLLATLLGNFFGAVPGLGGDAATWICYGHAVQTSKSNENFGKGDIRGVIGVETANNSKEGAVHCCRQLSSVSLEAYRGSLVLDLDYHKPQT